MSIPDIIDLSSDDEAESMDIKDVKTHLLPNVNGSEAIEQKIRAPNNYRGANQVELHTNEFCHASSAPNYPLPVCRQFWKSGEYESGKDLIPSPLNGKSRLRIHPKFLHSNATSHKWAFGAVAELLDNAVDEVKNGATFVIVDRFIDPHNGNSALLIRDDGGGMDPNSLRRCISFGFSDKQTNCSIGQYGNGFKTSTMRLGADAIVFSRSMSNGKFTQSVGLLSYTFLMQTRSDDIVVPVIDYEYNKLNNTFERLFRHDQMQFSANLSTILRWSLFSSEEELLKQFNDIGEHGTKIIIYNLWFNDDGTMELDFESDPEDIMISGSNQAVTTNSIKKNLTQDHVSNRLHYSLRVYASILYLQMPVDFNIVLRERVVEPHNIVNDLNYLECVKYKPKAYGIGEAEVVTFIGYVKGAPNINVHGFNVYHRNRLILPFWKVANNSYGKGRGVAGVLEANFIKPTHDKQDFEKSLLYQKLENRLKEMTYEYWDYHCHLLGYTRSKAPNLAVSPPGPLVPHLPQLGAQSCAKQQTTKILAPELSISTQENLGTSLLSADRNGTTLLNALIPSKLGKSSENNVIHQTVVPEKRRHEGHTDRAAKRQVIMVIDSDERNRRAEDMMAVMRENKKLRSQCSESEEEEKQLLLKEKRLRRELEEVQMTFKKLLSELKSNNGIKAEKL